MGTENKDSTRQDGALLKAKANSLATCARLASGAGRWRVGEWVGGRRSAEVWEVTDGFGGADRICMRRD